jgi:hypothetical protein
VTRSLHEIRPGLLAAAAGTESPELVEQERAEGQ